MNLDELYNFISYVAEKEKAGYTMSPTEYNLLLPVAQQEFANIIWDEYEKTQKYSDILSVLETHLGDTLAPLTVDSNGHATLPSDYWHYDSAMLKRVISYDSDGEPEIHEVPIDIITGQQFNYRKGSQLEVPTKDYPIATVRDGYIDFLPKDLRRVVFTYLHLPSDPVYAYTIDANDDIVYNASGSTELEFPAYTHLRIARILLSKVGINLSKEELFQYAQIMQQMPGNE